MKTPAHHGFTSSPAVRLFAEFRRWHSTVLLERDEEAVDAGIAARHGHRFHLASGFTQEGFRVLHPGRPQELARSAAELFNEGLMQRPSGHPGVPGNRVDVDPLAEVTGDEAQGLGKSLVADRRDFRALAGDDA